MAISRQRFGRQGQNTTSFRFNDRGLGPISNTILLIILTCVLGLLYLTQVTKTNSYSYRINDLQKQAVQLQQEHEQLEVASARLQAVDRVKSSDAAKNLVSVAPAGTVQN